VTDTPLPEAHLTDDDLSAAVDLRVSEAAAEHLAACRNCGARFEAFRSAAEWMATPVRELESTTRDAFVAAALAEAPPTSRTAGVIPIEGRRSRLAQPPLAALVGIAAALVALVGIAAVARTMNTSSNTLGNLTAGGPADTTGSADASANRSTAAGESVTSDPEAFSGDLGDYHDPSALVSALGGAGTKGALATATPATATASGSGAAGPAAASDKAMAVRAQCVERARALGAGRLGALQSTAAIRWNGAPGEVLVFALTEPAGGFTRQALVLSYPNCELRADPRF
jgi:hypothetical protein